MTAKKAGSSLNRLIIYLNHLNYLSMPTAATAGEGKEYDPRVRLSYDTKLLQRRESNNTILW